MNQKTDKQLLNNIAKMEIEKPVKITSAQRQKEWSDSQRAKGLKLLTLWAYPEHTEQLKRIAKLLRDQKENKSEQ